MVVSGTAALHLTRRNTSGYSRLQISYRPSCSSVVNSAQIFSLNATGHRVFRPGELALMLSRNSLIFVAVSRRDASPAPGRPELNNACLLGRSSVAPACHLPSAIGVVREINDDSQETSAAPLDHRWLTFSQLLIHILYIRSFPLKLNFGVRCRLSHRHQGSKLGRDA